jgi:hypothetical protein
MNKKYLALLLAVLFVVAVVAGWYATQYFRWPVRQDKQPLIELKGGENAAGGNVTVTENDTTGVKIFVPSDDGIKVQELKIKTSAIPVRMAEAVATEYVKELQGGMKNTRLLGVYRDKKGIVYVDMSGEFQREFSGDVRQEYELLKSLYETIMENVPGTDDVKLLIDDKEVESVGGHFNTLHTLGEAVKEEAEQPEPENQ